MDNLLAGTLFSLFDGVFNAGSLSSAAAAPAVHLWKTFRSKPNAIPVGDKNCSPSHRNRRSLSDRNTVRIHNGMVFGFRPESRSSSTGFPTYLVLMPLIYLRYRFLAAWKEAKELDTYILRCSLSGAFGGSSDTLLDAITNKIEDLKTFNLAEVFGVVQSQGRSLAITEDRLWEAGYGSDAIHLLFNLWYRQFNYTPAFENNLPQV